MTTMMMMMSRTRTTSQGSLGVGDLAAVMGRVAGRLVVTQDTRRLGNPGDGSP